MSTIFLRTKTAYSECDQHLSSTNSQDTPIESYLTQHVLVLLCAEMQIEMYKIVEEKARTIENANIEAYINTSVRRILRSVRKDEIATLVGMFGTICKETLNANIDDVEVTRYNNAVKDRHGIAHNVGTDVSFEETAVAIISAEKLLQAVKIALAIDESDGAS